ncbi:succinate dehydrogenase, cytochrome b556 subunit [Chenggangzhangella methanolivorans]|uniref:Succinate dehydrogenase cytochrome b556 subunit n=1 Tax=Chenggangzhangella methanolivorans TaxID=1437009 RepID=A0A9E6R5G8_9HYPH|nr:succinate dehydrogenase, cytochrome b556 subunit [Chenggangzhangella methanolivorans]QZN98228.1 succinate dehydrogenase, cytochrome b556 subunit [Chenggangzhangella methanolivorans]
MDSGKAAANRPLSPHLQIYRPMLSMIMSIVHRITGAALYFGTALIVIWLVSAAAGPSAFAAVQSIYGSFLGQLVLFGYTWALVHHAIGGIRHLIWDVGRGFGPERELLYRLSLGGSIVLTIVIWIVGYALKGAAG